MSENNNDFLEELFNSSSENVENSAEEPEIHNSFEENAPKFSFEEEKPRKEKKNGVSFATLFISVIASALIAAIISTSVSSVFLNKNTNDIPQNNVQENTNNSNQDNVSGSTTNIEISGVTESVIEAVALKVNPSVVGIVTTAATTSFFGGGTETTGEGSGIIYTSDGYIITNYHVIQSAVTSKNTSIEVYLASNSEKPYTATVVGYNISYDLAVIKVQANSLPSIDFADSSQLKVGQYVAAVGSPGGMQFMGSVTYGIISGLNRVVSDSSSSSSVELIQTDAAINPGNSGGALVNTKGLLIGINSSKIAATAYEGMGFAIPSNTVKEICDNIIAKENDPNPYIGITISERYNAETLTQLGYPVGAVVKSVIGGSPAENAGIRSGDIIVKFGDVDITEYSVLTDAISNSRPGDTVAVKIYRSGRYYSTSLKVGSNNSQ
ncbi:MAG: trypsin-like peptidase domain-containing protein [Clostridia bacterium]|nr:trypsin-like peptidase domain-containing protein [Clostridia bacterium]